MLGSWVKLQKSLIDLERDTEINQLTDKISSLGAKDCQNEGLSILNLEIDGTRSAMFGRCCIILQKMDKKQLQSSFKVGDEVNLYNPKLKSASTDNDNGTVFGLVSKVTNFKIEMVVEDFDENCFDAPLRLDLRSNQKTHNKMIEAISSLEGSDHPLVQMLFSDQSQSLYCRVVVQDIKLDRMYNNNLNQSQINAIKCSLGSPFVSLIHGPPGTGKTSTLTELILQAVQRDLKVLVCAPSNIAVDTILARLADSSFAKPSGNDNKKKSSSGTGSGSGSDYQRKLNMVRIGHPARISANILQYSLDSLIEHDEGTEIVQDVRKDIDDLRKSLSARSTKAKRVDYSVRREQRTELRALCKEAQKREKTVVERILKRSNVVLSTCIGASSRLLSQCEFDLVVIDEAAQGLEAACWVPLLLAKKCVLAGDHCQLPPTIKSDEAVKGGLAVTLFERIIKDSRFEPVVKLLNVQYRMNDLISQWASKEMYHGLIESDVSVATHTLNDIIKPATTGVADNEVSSTEIEEAFPVMLLIDTADCGMNEELVAENGSHRNVHEAEIVVKHIQALLKAGVKPNQIGVITPYNGQLEVLRNLILPSTEQEGAVNKGSNAATTTAGVESVSMEGVECKTIDGFQGGEKECIIISLVRSNDSRTVGFLSDTRRMNVAVTRAKRHVAVIGDTETCGTNKFIRSLIDHIGQHGEHISAYEYLDTVDVVGSMETVRIDTNVSDLSLNSATETDKINQATTQTVFRNDSSVDNSYRVKATKAEKVSAGKVSSDLDFRTLFQSLLDGTTGYGSVVLTTDNQLLSPAQQLAQVTNSTIPAKYMKQQIKSANKSKVVASSLIFPSSLNSYQRMSCHEVATQMGLHHRSVGEGSDRYVEVSRESFVEVSAVSTSTKETVAVSVSPVEIKIDPKPIKETTAKTDKNNNTSSTSKAASNDKKKNTVTSNCAKSKLLDRFPEPEQKTKASILTLAEESPSDDEDAEEGEEDVYAPIGGVKQPTVWDDEVKTVLSKDNNIRNVRVSTKVDEKVNCKIQSAYQTEKKTKQKADKNKVGKGMASSVANVEEDDDAILNAAILENQKLAKLNQYRVSGTAMPNYDREQNKKRLQDKLTEAQTARKSAAVLESEKEGVGTNKKKVVKKPTPNFGGGKLGTK